MLVLVLGLGFRFRFRVRVRVRLKVLLTRLSLGVLHAFVREWLARSHYHRNQHVARVGEEKQVAPHGGLRTSQVCNGRMLPPARHKINYFKSLH